MADQKPTEEVKNCPACKKIVKKAKRFYRNGKYFCNANCARAFKAKAGASAEEAPAA